VNTGEFATHAGAARGRVAAVRGAMLRLAGVLRTARVHTTDNRALADALDGLQQRLAPLVAELRGIRVGVADGLLRVNGGVVAELNHGSLAELRDLEQDFSARGVGGLHLLEAPSTEELRAFVGLWRSRTSVEVEDGAALLNEGLAALRVQNIRALPKGDAASESAAGAGDRGVDEVLRACSALMAVAESLCEPVATRTQDGNRRADAALHVAADLAATAPSLMLCAAAHRDSSRYPVVHAVNVCVLSMLLARRIGLSLDAMLDVGRGAFYADLSMAPGADSIRSQAGELDGDSTQRVLDHPLLGFRDALAEGVAEAGRRARAVVAWEHHCGVDGEGYPGPAPGGAPHLYSRIVAVADAYDAVLHDRADRPGVARPAALEVIYQEAGSRFDRELLHEFCAMLGRFPPGSAVRLREGHSGLVLLPAEDPRLFDRPLVIMTRDGSGEALAEPFEVDLGTHRGARASRVTHVLDDRIYPEKLTALAFGPAGFLARVRG
jgi:HD-GYP domain-containing protein (c-di-GMP phosphodiesterase class II)